MSKMGLQVGVVAGLIFGASSAHAGVPSGCELLRDGAIVETCRFERDTTRDALARCRLPGWWLSREDGATSARLEVTALRYEMAVVMDVDSSGAYPTARHQIEYFQEIYADTGYGRWSDVKFLVMPLQGSGTILGNRGDQILRCVR